MLNDSESLFGIHGRKQVWSLDMPMANPNPGQGAYNYTFADYVGAVLADQEGFDHIEVTKHFSKFIQTNYSSLLTPKQVEYLEMSDDDRNKTFKKNTRWNYRKRIQQTMMTAYFGEPITMTRRLETYLDGMVTTAHLLLLQGCPEEFTKFVIDNLDSNYINKLVYETLDTDMRKEVVTCYYNGSAVLKDFTINTICEYAEDDYKSFQEKIK